jgi:YbgC/YbaW family acyl-CoA thioester hydrolase
MGCSPFTIDEYVRWSDVDRAGIIFYGAYVRFFEIAEMELLREAGGSYSEVLDKFEIDLPRVHLRCDFKYPARLDDQLRVAAYFTRFGTSSLGINFDVIHLGTGKLAALGHEVLVCTDRNVTQSRPLPKDLLELLMPYRCDEAEVRAELSDWAGQRR